MGEIGNISICMARGNLQLRCGIGKRGKKTNRFCRARANGTPNGAELNPRWAVTRLELGLWRSIFASKTRIIGRVVGRIVDVMCVCLKVGNTKKKEPLSCDRV